MIPESQIKSLIITGSIRMHRWFLAVFGDSRVS